MPDNKKRNQDNRFEDKKPNDGKSGGFKGLWQGFNKNILIWLVIIIASVTIGQLFLSEPNVVPVSYTTYEKYISEGLVASAQIVGKKFVGELKHPLEDYSGSMPRKYSKFSTIIPYMDSDVTDKWDEQGLTYEFKEPTPGIMDYLIQLSPWLLLLVLWIFIMRRMQSGGGQNGIFGFAKSRAKIISPDNPQITFQNVAGCDEAKVELQEIVEFLKHPKRFTKLGAKIPKGALLLGPPGTGKTLLAKAVSGEAGVPFFSISGAEFVEMFVGVGASRVRDLFDQAKRNSPAIIFIDEIDAVGRHRGAGLGGGHDEREQTLNQILVEMDGFETDDNVIMLAATNRPDVLDKALLRPGRFDRQIVVDVPGIDGREAILKIHTKNIPLAKDVRLKTVAKGTPGLVGADLENLCNESALLAARRNKRSVSMSDFEDAKDKVMMGVERKSMILTPEDKKITAYHEAGHALVALHTAEADPVHKITITPRGRALGITAQLPEHEKFNYSKKFLLGRLNVLMGGRAAEEIIFKDMTTGAGNDIDVATGLARSMVCEWGMSSRIGPLSFGKKSEEVFLGREISHARDYSDDVSQMIDREITSFVKTAYENAKRILNKHNDQLHKLAETLLEYESISGEEMQMILEGKAIVRKGSGGDKTPRRTRPRRKPPVKQGDKTAPNAKRNAARPKPPEQRKTGPAPKQKKDRGEPSVKAIVPGQSKTKDKPVQVKRERPKPVDKKESSGPEKVKKDGPAPQQKQPVQKGKGDVAGPQKADRHKPKPVQKGSEPSDKTGEKITSENPEKKAGKRYPGPEFKKQELAKDQVKDSKPEGAKKADSPKPARKSAPTKKKPPVRKQADTSEKPEKKESHVKNSAGRPADPDSGQKIDRNEPPVIRFGEHD